MGGLVNFYRSQEAWVQAYTRDISDVDRARCERVERLVGPSPKTVLELGAGGGQTAVSLAELGYDTTVVEMVPEFVQHIAKLSKSQGVHLRVFPESFYTVQLESNRYDLVCYWDGFGVGSDGEQRQLLERVASWLKNDGLALFEVYSPWYWSRIRGRSMRFGKIVRRYDFDYRDCRFVDTWQIEGGDNPSVSQSLRCYSPMDLELLLHGTGLEIVSIELGGAYDHDTGTFRAQAPIEDAMTYFALLRGR